MAFCYTENIDSHPCLNTIISLRVYELVKNVLQYFSVPWVKRKKTGAMGKIKTCKIH